MSTVFHGIDQVANSINPMHHFGNWLTDNTVARIPGIGKPIGQFADWTNNHPAEVGAAAGLAAGAFMGAPALLAAGGGEAAAGGTAMGTAAGTLGAADSAAASSALGLSAADVAGTSGAVAGSGATTAAGLGGLSTFQEAQLGLSAASLAKSALAGAPKLAAPAPVTQLPNGPESQGGSAAQAAMAGTGQAGGAPGVAQTLLTGAGGIDPSTIGLGKNTLLGG